MNFLLAMHTFYHHDVGFMIDKFSVFPTWKTCNPINIKDITINNCVQVIKWTTIATLKNTIKLVTHPMTNRGKYILTSLIDWPAQYLCSNKQPLLLLEVEIYFLEKTLQW